MELFVCLVDVIDGNFKFFLSDSFRGKIFTKLKQRYKDWRIVAHHLGMDARNLFGVRRGFELYSHGKQKRFLSSHHLRIIKESLNINWKDIEKNVEMVKSGPGGQRSAIAFPFKIELEKESPYTMRRSLAEHVLMKKYHIDTKRELPTYFKVNGDIVHFDVDMILHDFMGKKVVEFQRRGLNPEVKEQRDRFIFKYRNPGTNHRVTRVIPKNVLLDCDFMKEFGKWMGDRCGGPHKIGVANGEWNFIENFRCLLQNNLLQGEDVTVSLRYNSLAHSRIIKELKEKFPVKNVEYSETQHGKYSFVVSVSNKLLKNLVFDTLEKYFFIILQSSSQTLRYSYYAGFFDADGSVSCQEIMWSFGMNLQKWNHEKNVELLHKALMFKKMLEFDGFHPYISRKVSRTMEGSTLKYDIKICHNKTSREKDLKRFKDMVQPFINHYKKLDILKEMYYESPKDKKSGAETREGLVA